MYTEYFKELENKFFISKRGVFVISRARSSISIVYRFIYIFLWQFTITRKKNKVYYIT